MGLCDRPFMELRDDGLEADLAVGLGELRYDDDMHVRTVEYKECRYTD